MTDNHGVHKYMDRSTSLITTIPEDTKKLQKPCNECPFSKTIKPGFLGGSDATVYVGQGYGPFWLPCHKNCDFSNSDWKKDVTAQQCAGAAIYRANTGRDHLFPSFMHRLPKDACVFESPEQLLAHHKNISLEEAAEFLRKHSPAYWYARELEKVHKPVKL
jgi:hypothetical protein